MRTTRRSRDHSHEAGQNLIEFALLTPFVLLFVYAIVQFGILMNTRASLQQAVREGARQAALGTVPVATVQALAAGNAPEVISASDVEVCLPSGSSGQSGQQVRVDIRQNGSAGYQYTLAPLITKFFGPLRLNPKGTAILEHSATYAACQ